MTHTLLVPLADTTVALMKNYRFRDAITASSTGAAQTMLQLVFLADDGKLEKWEHFIEISKALVDVATRECDMTGKAMKGVRYSDVMIQLATVLRGYGPKSASLYGTLSALIPIPSFVQIRCVCSISFSMSSSF
jgi:hypothetical protein